VTAKSEADSTTEDPTPDDELDLATAARSLGKVLASARATMKDLESEVGYTLWVLRKWPSALMFLDRECTDALWELQTVYKEIGKTHKDLRLKEKSIRNWLRNHGRPNRW
jgi:hypothetical protein